MARVPWPEDQKAAFLRMQFQAQHHHYTTHFPEARFDVIERGAEPIGRLYVDVRWDEVRLIDIALVPDERGRGIGSAYMRALMDEARAAGLPLTLHVEPFNPAQRLYRRLGFETLGEEGVYHFMRWDPD